MRQPPAHTPVSGLRSSYRQPREEGGLEPTPPCGLPPEGTSPFLSGRCIRTLAHGQGHSSPRRLQPMALHIPHRSWRRTAHTMFWNGNLPQRVNGTAESWGQAGSHRPCQVSRQTEHLFQAIQEPPPRGHEPGSVPTPCPLCLMVPSLVSILGMLCFTQLQKSSRRGGMLLPSWSHAAPPQPHESRGQLCHCCSGYV